MSESVDKTASEKSAGVLSGPEALQKKLKTDFSETATVLVRTFRKETALEDSGSEDSCFGEKLCRVAGKIPHLAVAFSEYRCPLVQLPNDWGRRIGLGGP